MEEELSVPGLFRWTWTSGSRNGANGDQLASLHTERPLASIIQMKETKGPLYMRTIEFHKRITSRQWGITWPAYKINICFTSPVD